jgi:hypothetical protein
MTILADQTVFSHCPAGLPGCGGHIDGDVHISVEQMVVATAGPEHTEIYVSRELAPGKAPAVRIQGAPDTPMQLAEALQLLTALAAEIAAAMAWGGVR